MDNYITVRGIKSKALKLSDKLHFYKCEEFVKKGVNECVEEELKDFIDCLTLTSRFCFPNIHGRIHFVNNGLTFVRVESRKNKNFI